jgi:TRAP-type C4-dicarboxylate transport system permease small subunit
LPLLKVFMMKVIQTIIDGIFKIFETVMVLCIATMLVMVFGNVILRIFFNTGIDLFHGLLLSG